MAALQKLEQDLLFLPSKLLLTGQLRADGIGPVDGEGGNAPAVGIGVRAALVGHQGIVLAIAGFCPGLSHRIGLLFPGHPILHTLPGVLLIGTPRHQQVDLSVIDLHVLAVLVGVGVGLSRDPGGVVDVLPGENGVILQQREVVLRLLHSQDRSQHGPVRVPGRSVHRLIGIAAASV